MENYDFSCWVIKYDGKSIYGKIYRKGCLKECDGMIVPLLWNHRHGDPDSVLGHALLEHCEEGVYAYCTLNDGSCKEIVEQLIHYKGSVALSPYVNKLKIVSGKYIASGVIREVSLVPERIDPDEAYYPVMKESEKGE